MDDRTLKQLALMYDQSLLVPFIGSGMSSPQCALWPSFVDGLEKQAERYGHVASQDSGLIERAYSAMQTLRLAGLETGECVRTALFADQNPAYAGVPQQTAALAKLRWPLVCTTNYDDMYFRAKREAPRRGAFYLLGRSASDCRDLLQELRFPTREILWAVQGFLRPMLDDHGIPSNKIKQLEDEIVVGHAEYRTLANREPHFRRAFGEVFRTRSFLFLGSGLSEPYFRQLFDEIIALTGFTDRPHFAIIPHGKIDRDFMRQNYNIECFQYPTDQHDYVSCMLDRLADAVKGPRARQTSWGFRLSQASCVDSGSAIEHFKVVRSKLPRPATLPSRDAVAISCGVDSCRVLVNRDLAGSLQIQVSGFPAIHGGEKIVQHRDAPNIYGIVAREPKGDERSPRVVRTAFAETLQFVAEHGHKTLHVQLLAAGPNKVFRPWISLVQMARAYGDWFRKNPDNRLSVHLYIVDPSVLSLLQGSFINLAEHLEDTKIRINIQTYPSAGVNRHQRLVKPGIQMHELIKSYPTTKRKPRIDVLPRVHSVKPPGQGNMESGTIEDFGLVSGSTLILDYRSDN